MELVTIKPFRPFGMLINAFCGRYRSPLREDFLIHIYVGILLDHTAIYPVAVFSLPLRKSPPLRIPFPQNTVLSIHIP